MEKIQLIVQIIFLKKNYDYYIPLIEIVILNGGLCAVNKYIGERGWANIGTLSIKQNFENGFDWDTDGFPCNMLDHPYHGSHYYAAARSSGNNYYNSLIFTAVGSFQWEYFMETERPSTNDFIMTTAGGSLLGEIFFRSSNYLLNLEKKGVKKYLYNFLGFIISPYTFVNNKLIVKKPFQQYEEKSEKDIDVEMLFGSTNLKLNNKLIENIRFYSFNYSYSNLDNDILNPFDFYRFRISLMNDEKNLYKFLEVDSVLTAKNIINSQSYYGLWAAYDYYEGFEFDRFSAVGFGPGLYYKKGIFYSLSRIYFIMGAASARHGIIYGDKYYESKGETYNFGKNLKNGAYYFGNGMLVKTSSGIRFYNFVININSIYAWVHSLHATDANEHRLSINGNMKYYIKDLFIGMRAGYIGKKSFYDDYDIITDNERTLSLYLGINL